jgi:hypothetical protein
VVIIQGDNQFDEAEKPASGLEVNPSCRRDPYCAAGSAPQSYQYFRSKANKK